MAGMEGEWVMEERGKDGGWENEKTSQMFTLCTTHVDGQGEGGEEGILESWVWVNGQTEWIDGQMGA